jgi:hypothetical protein
MVVIIEVAHGECMGGYLDALIGVLQGQELRPKTKLQGVIMEALNSLSLTSMYPHHKTINFAE